MSNFAYSAMSRNKVFEVLDALPAYGPMHVAISDRDMPFYAEGYVVRFYRSDGTDWVANFWPGSGRLNGVFGLRESELLLVIASGTCYLMSANEEEPVGTFGGDYERAWKLEDGTIILQDTTGLSIIGRGGAVWHSDRISWDGLREVELSGSVVTGLAYHPTADDDEWVPFSYDVESRKLSGGSYTCQDKAPKQWWQFWR